MSVRINVRLSTDLHGRLKSASDYHGMDFGEILRRARRKAKSVGVVFSSDSPTVIGEGKRHKKPTGAIIASFYEMPDFFNELLPDYLRALLDWYLTNYDRRHVGFVTDKVEGRDYVIADDFERCANG